MTIRQSKLVPDAIRKMAAARPADAPVSLARIARIVSKRFRVPGK